ncbi:LLM class flavin-dependent oxidoreductase [Actinomadura sp. LD22]|uniref:LLM class flavin-dependent oxidoreductase n=1 Tax=Actinomadura physcomitrii TaxID=2650748 RepID=A0A6I4M1Q6_9ACTN|nr:LLM class flavin-dependent oxidoreductase [Actinomadura physcomitrii]
MEIIVRVPPCRPVRELVELTQHMEDLGVDRVSFPDSQLLWREVWSTVSAVAVSTERIGLAVSVTNPVTRHPTVTASAARSIAEIAPGRLTLAVGAGDSALTHIGERPVRSQTLEHAVGAIRTLLAGEEVAHGVHPWRLHHPVAVPVTIGASGPRNLALAGRIADGAVIPSMAWDRDTGIVRDAAKAAGRDPDDLSYTMTRSCVITDDPERDAVVFKPMCLRLAQLGGAELFAAAGVPVDVPDHDLELGDLGHPEDWDEAVKTCSAWISDEAALWFARTRSLFGTPDEVVAQLRELERNGVRSILLSHPGAFSLPSDLIETLGESVLPSLRRSGS